jgi:hypothetical protein
VKLRTLFLSALMAGLAQAGAATADVTPIEIKVDEKEIGLIQVGGHHHSGGYGSSHGDAYAHVMTWTLNYSIWARGDAPASQGNTPSYVLIEMRSTNDANWTERQEGQLYDVWYKYRISFPYSDHYAIGNSEARLAPIKRCNDELRRTAGEARKEFLFKGTTITVNKVYKFRGRLPRHFGGEGDVDQTYAPVTIECRPLDPVPVRSTLRIEPAKLEKRGQFVCPMELRLYGAVESREAFSGKSIFIGPHYLSAITDLNFTKAGNRNVGATYKVKWQQMGGLTTAPNQEPKKQDLTFRLNIADKSGKVVETAEERVQVSCRKIKSNAPTASSDMTINPAN